MNHLERAILWTVLYGDIFDFPMTSAEIHRYLLYTPATRDEVEQALHNPLSPLQHYLTKHEHGEYTWYALTERAEQVLATRTHREQFSSALWDKAIRHGRWLNYLPYVRMVALTGSLAVRNVTSIHDDFDYLLVIQDGRVWFTRLLAVGMVRLAKLWGVVLCPNYVLAESALVQQRQNSFIAHELAQMYPVAGHRVYLQMLAANEWARIYLPNAHATFYPLPEARPRLLFSALKQALEWVWSGRPGNWLENWERERKTRKFTRQITHQSAAQLDEQHVKGHFQDYGQVILARFYERLKAYNLPLPPHFTSPLAANVSHDTDYGEGAAD
jgi:hypothetical protein